MFLVGCASCLHPIREIRKIGIENIKGDGKMSEINEVTPKEVEKMIDDKEIIIIDVREDEEVAQGIIEKAKHIPLGDIPEAVADLDKNKSYILVCRSGARSMNASKYMDEQGFKVSNMKGGMLEWEGEVIVG